MPLSNDETPIAQGTDVSSSEGLLVYGSDSGNLAKQLKVNQDGNLIVGTLSGSNANPFWITGSVTTSDGGTVTQGTKGTIAESWFVRLTDGSAVIGTAINNALFVTGAVTSTVPNTVTITGSVGVNAFPSFATNGGPMPSVGNLIGGTSNGTDFRVLSTDASGKLNVNATLPTPSVAGTGSIAPYSASLVGFKDLNGNNRAITGDNQGSLYVTYQDQIATGTLGSLNAEIRLALSGSTGAGFQLASGTLVGTLSCEISFDNGTTWAPTGFFDIDTKGLSDTIVFATSNTAQTKGLTVPQGGGLVRVRVSAYTSGTANGTLRASNTGTQVIYVSQLDGRRSTYTAYTAAFTAATTATDIFTIQGSATKIIRILRVEIYVTQTTAAAGNIFLIKRSAANTGGTSVAATRAPFDSVSAAATATVQHYTANPTALGASVGNIRAFRGIVPAPTTVINNPVASWEFGTKSGSAIVLRNINELLAVNLSGVTITGNSFIIGCEWTEE
jgi:hypothetical protein